MRAPVPADVVQDRVVGVTLNPAVDVTPSVDALLVGASVRVQRVRSRSGGKGANVASVVHALGAATAAIALTGIREPDEFAAGRPIRKQ